MTKLLVLLLFVNLGFCQNQGFEVSYDISFSNHKLKKNLKSIYFTLLVNKNQSYFFANTIMGVDESKYERFIEILENQIYYIDLENQLKLGGIKVSGEKLLVEEEWIKDWELKNEFKKILGYRCQKAIRLIKDSKNNKTTVVTAWFSKDLLFPFGPKNFEGLPGLILEYGDKIKFSAKSITLKNIKIERPLGKVLTGEELRAKTFELIKN
jgi:GLPGLI family protein